MTDIEADLMIANAEIKRLQAQLAEANKRIETKETLLRLQGTTMSMLSSDKDMLIHKLRDAESKLAASQRRADAAVEDLKFMSDKSDTPCLKCTYYTGNYVCHPYCSGCGHGKSFKWQWRGKEKNELD